MLSVSFFNIHSNFTSETPKLHLGEDAPLQFRNAILWIFKKLKKLWEQIIDVKIQESKSKIQDLKAVWVLIYSKNNCLLTENSPHEINHAIDLIHSSGLNNDILGIYFIRFSISSNYAQNYYFLPRSLTSANFYLIFIIEYLLLNTQNLIKAFGKWCRSVCHCFLIVYIRFFNTLDYATKYSS